MSNFLLITLVNLLVGFLIGWVYAHSVVATECRRLGGFYVDGAVFKCTEIKEKE